MMHALHGMYLVPAEDRPLGMIAPHKLLQWGATLPTTTLSYFTRLYVPELCIVYDFFCVTFAILFTLFAV
jgi:hypothetical protein